jgi:hypothetical protein
MMASETLKVPQALPRNLHMAEVWAAGWVRPPATFQDPPNIIREPVPFHSLRSLRMFASTDFRNDGLVFIPGERNVPTQDFIYDHPKRVTIRRFCPTAVFETEALRIEELWTHPPVRTSLSV